MIFSLFRRKPQRDTISALYGMIVAQARLPVFYRDYTVADTVNGRFDLIVLHLALVLDRLTVEGQLDPAGQAVFDRFCEDMDDNLREMGVGDLTVPKRMRKFGEAFYGRSAAYDAALEAGHAELAVALNRNIFNEADAANADRLAAYVTEALAHLGQIEQAAFVRGQWQFPAVRA